MSDKLDQPFMGTISGVTQWGFYVELNDTKCEGLVSMTELEDDYYEFDEAELLHCRSSPPKGIPIGRSGNGQSGES